MEFLRVPMGSANGGANGDGSANGDGVSGFFARKKATNPVPVGTPDWHPSPHFQNILTFLTQNVHKNLLPLYQFDKLGR